MIRSSLCGYSDAYIIGRGTITIDGEWVGDVAKRVDERNKGVIVKNCLPFTKCITDINNTQSDNAKD